MSTTEWAEGLERLVRYQRAFHTGFVKLTTDYQDRQFHQILLHLRDDNEITGEQYERLRRESK